ncbi:hypothetical protein FE257_005826 [Aspergillus nanangensis]|uniref:AMP-dependent synthetase/ligase domain-containing protein n=1 Tax=Aspergillus nanangensis TaxID=2582783 RepID=A0AAD4CA31_ASPNN|nr:hypothetical protein FE257_005826 [Aspergillus nanangensis]
MSSASPPGPRIYRSKDIQPLIPRNESVWQYYLRCNPDLVPDDKVILQEQENPSVQVTYGEMREKASKGAAGLQKLLGLKEGDVIAIWVHYLHVAEAQVFFADSVLIAKFREAQRLDASGRLSQLRVVSLDAGVPGQTDIPQWPQDFLGVGSAPVLDLSNRDNKTVPAVICFSSGTSGSPKGALLSHHSMIGYVTGPRCFGSSALNRNDVDVFYAPLCHIYGMVAAVLAPAFIGHLMVIMRAYKFHEYIKACQENQATIMRVVPPAAMAIAKDPSMRDLNLSSVHTLVCAGAALGEETQAGLQRLLKNMAAEACSRL